MTDSGVPTSTHPGIIDATITSYLRQSEKPLTVHALSSRTRYSHAEVTASILRIAHKAVRK
jgi:hypothetical protein